MSALANAGINILSRHKYSKSNALHLAVERELIDCVRLLVDSDYPLDEKMQLGLTPLILATRSKT